MPVRGRSSWLPDGPGLAAVGQTVRLWHDPVTFQQQALRRYGEPFTLRIKPIGELVVVSDPETVLEIFRGDPETFRAGRANGPSTRVCSARRSHHPDDAKWYRGNRFGDVHGEAEPLTCAQHRRRRATAQTTRNPG